MNLRSTVSRWLAVALVAMGISIAGLTVSAQPALAYSTVCKTLYLSKQSITYTPRMTVPVCYNGSRIWQNGGVTPGVTLIGYTLGGFTWYGTYNSGGTWMGVGENMSLNFGVGPLSYTITCDPRWILNANGAVTSSSYGC